MSAVVTNFASQIAIESMVSRLEVLETREAPEGEWLTAGVTFSGTWAEQSGSGTYGPFYRQVGRFIYLRTFVKRTGTTGGTVMTMPAGYRPTLTTHTTVSGLHGSGAYFFSPCNIQSSGVITIFNFLASSVTWMHINMWWTLD